MCQQWYSRHAVAKKKKTKEKKIAAKLRKELADIKRELRELKKQQERPSVAGIEKAIPKKAEKKATEITETSTPEVLISNPYLKKDLTKSLILFILAIIIQAMIYWFANNNLPAPMRNLKL